MAKTTPTAEQILKAFTNYQRQLAYDSKVSTRKFQDMQTAIVGCKMLVRDLYGLPRQRENAMLKD